MRLPALVLVGSFVAAVSCGRDPPARLISGDDAGAEASADSAADVGTRDVEVGDASPYLGGPCVDDTQCNDGIACTYDSCDQAVGRCLNVPDGTQCQDGVYCDGVELCVPGHGCEPGPVVACDDGDACHITTCVETSKQCSHVDRDVDGDGDPDAHCDPGHDCNDLDADVSSLHAEVCANHVDDNCNGLVDEQPCVTPAGDTCANAVAASAPGATQLSTVGANDTFATSCSVTQPSSAQNVVAAITVPPGGNVDLEVWASGYVEIAVAIQGSCGTPSTELACGSGKGATDVRARARNVAPGTYYAVVTTQSPSSVEIQVSLLAPTSAPMDVDCASATPLQPGTGTTVTIIDPPTVLPTACLAGTGALTYSFALAQPQDVRVYGSTLQGSGVPILGLRSPHCTGAADELACGSVQGSPLYERNLPAGTYVMTVAATSPIDASVEVQLSPPTVAPPDQTCASPPALSPNQTLAWDLSDHENAVKDGCAKSGPDAAYDLSLTVASDVLLVDRYPQTEQGYLSFDTPACTAATSLGCVAGSTPLRLGRRNVPAGDYRVAIADVLGFQGTLQALVRHTVAPTILPAGAADTCATAIDASSGGFFTGDTSTASADYTEGCDAPGQSGNGAPDQVLALTLTQNQRVVLDMEGSAYTTLLAVTQGPACPGAPVGGACYVGFGQGSFLDLELTAGAYWLTVKGYSGAKGVWDLDVRVLPP
ncbi:MAG TPA: putative metal-binding motif-containing protein [Polyangiaceae bacterium]